MAPEPPSGLGRLTTIAAVGEGPPFLLRVPEEPVPPNGASEGPGGRLRPGEGQPGFPSLFRASFMVLGSEDLRV